MQKSTQGMLAGAALAIGAGVIAAPSRSTAGRHRADRRGQPE